MLSGTILILKMLMFDNLVQAVHCIVCVPDLPPSLFSREINTLRRMNYCKIKHRKAFKEYKFCNKTLMING